MIKKDLSTLKKNEFIDIQGFFHHLALNIFGDLAFHWDFRNNHEDSERFLGCVIRGSVVVGWSIRLAIPFERKNPIIPVNRQLHRDCQEMRVMAGKYIDSRLAQLEKEGIKVREPVLDSTDDYDSMIESEEKEEETSKVPKDILTVLLEANIPREHMIDEIITLLAAGHETTAFFCSFVIYNLCTNPDVQLKLKDEVDSILQGRTVVTREDIQKMTYMSAVLKESLRLHTVVPFLSRDVLEDFDLTPFGYPGMVIPKGETVFMGPFVIHRDPDSYPDPFKFKPDRFLNVKIGATQDFIPFGYGKRICIGQNLALMESTIMIALMVQQYQFVFQEGFQMELMSYITLRSQNGIPVTAIPWKKDE